MNRQADAQLMQALRSFLRDESLIQQAQGLPTVAPQAVQSGSVTPQDVGQTLGPQPGERPNASREEWLSNFGQAAGSMAASAADPLGIPSALLGTLAPGARDSWRQYQGAAGMGPQLAGSLMSGFGAANAMFRGGAAMAGVPGMIAGGAATGAGPAIDYAAGAPGASGLNAMVAPAIGAAFPLGNLARANPGVAASIAGLGVLGLSGEGNEATAADPKGRRKAPARPVAQPAQSQAPPAADQPMEQPATPLDAQTQQLLANNPGLRARYDALQQARRDLETARQTSVVESRGPTGNRGAREAAAAARTAFDAAQSAFNTAVSEAAAQARAANPSFREFFGPLAGNPLALQFGLPVALGAITRGGTAALARNRNARTSTAIDEGNTALAAGNIPLAQQYSTNANAMLQGAQTGAGRRLGDISLGDALAGGAAGEMAAFAPLVWDRGLPVGRPEQAPAAAVLSDPVQVATTFGRGLLGGIGGYKMGNALAGSANNYLGGRNLIAPTAEAGSLSTRIQQAVPPPAPPQPYRGQFRADFRDTVANAVTANRGLDFNRAELLNGISVFPTRRPQLEAALREVERDLALARTAAERTAIAQRIRSGGYPNLVIAGGAAGAAAHHSLSQPRDDGGRFVGENP